MAPNSYLLVWASGKDRTNNISALHTNFKLGRDGGYLALVLPDGLTKIILVHEGQVVHADVSDDAAMMSPLENVAIPARLSSS